MGNHGLPPQWSWQASGYMQQSWPIEVGKSGGKVSKKIELKEPVVVHFPSRPELTINCDGIGD